MRGIRKALVAAAGAAIATLGEAAAAGHLGWAAVGIAIGAALAAGYATYRVENATSPAAK